MTITDTRAHSGGTENNTTDSIARTTQPVNNGYKQAPGRFDPRMYRAALAYYGLPSNYDRVFRRKALIDKETNQPLLDKKGQLQTILISCQAERESRSGNAVWAQVNSARPGTALKTITREGREIHYPKKAANADIGTLQNVTLDFEYPANPHIALEIGRQLADYLITQGIGAEELPIEDSGAGPHIGLPLPAIQIANGEEAERWNNAVAILVREIIQPEFLKLCEQAGIVMDLSGFDISRVLSLPGTWRPRNPEKSDCEMLQQGYLRRWCAPYVDGNYPARVESQQLREMLQGYYERCASQPKRERQVSRPVEQATAYEWLCRNAGQYYKDDRSTYFHALVAAVYLKWGSQAALDLAQDIDRLAGDKYGNRAGEEVERSLAKAEELGREDITYTRQNAPEVVSNKRVLVSPADPPLPEVIIGGQMRDTVVAAMTAIYQAEEQKQTIFVQSARLVQVACDEKRRPIIMQMHVAEIKNALTRTANYFRWREVKDETIAIPVSPPKEIAEAILALNPSEWKLPGLEAIVETPVMRPDGSILDQPGYDKATGLYYYPQKNMDTCKVPSNPTQKNIADALALIEDAIGEFPYVDEADKANAYAVLLTPLLRHAIPRHVPMALIDAPKQGTGKGLLADTVSIIATGSSSPVLTMSDSEEELQKSLTSLLMQGATIITIDNIAGRLQSRHLDAVLTADHWRGRVLGESRMVTVSQRATWLATGNNIHLGGDLARRCYRIRLDPHVSRPWMRTGFKHEDLATWVRDHRGELIGALLTLARAWFVAGKPLCEETPSLGTFTGWTKMMGGILYLCGIEGFLGNLEKLYDEADEESAQWETFLQAWRERHGDAWIKVGDLADQFKKELAGDDPKLAGVALSDFLPENLQLALKDKPQTFSVRLGKELGKRLETCFGNENLRLVRRVDSHSKKTEWCVVAGVAGVVPSLRPVGKNGSDEIQTHENIYRESSTEQPPQPPQPLYDKTVLNGLASGLTGKNPMDAERKATPANSSEGSARALLDKIASHGCSLRLDEQGEWAIGVPDEWTDEQYEALKKRVLALDVELRQALKERAA